MPDLEHLPDSLYRAIVQHMPIVTVDVVILDQALSRVLLFRRQNKPAADLFFTPGRRLIKGELIRNAAARVLQQELGLSVPTDELIMAGLTQEIWPDSAFDTPAHNVDIFFAWIHPGESITSIQLDTQHSESQWFMVTDRTLHPYLVEKIKKSVSALEADG